MERSTSYYVNTRIPEVIHDGPCLLLGITIHEENVAAVVYELYDNDGSGARMMRFLAPSKQTLSIKFPAPVAFGNQLYFYTADGAASPTAVFELA